MAIQQKERTRYRITNDEFKAFLAQKLSIQVDDIESFGVDPDDTSYFQVVLAETDV